MRRGRLFFSVIMCATFVLLAAAPSPAWELQLTGSMNWDYEYYYQLGSQGFFGPYNVDNGAGTATGNLNYWLGGGIRLQGQNFVTGADANQSYFYIILENF